MLNDEENKLRSILLNRMIQAPGAVDPSEIAPEANDAGINVSSILKGLQHKGLAVVQDDGSITGVYPFSALPTNHRVQFGSRKTVYAMCAIDSLGIVYELEKDVTIFSSCSHCKRHISIEIVDGKVSIVTPDTTLALHVSLSDYKDWASTC
jgi:hypothetical protein